MNKAVLKNDLDFQVNTSIINKYYSSACFQTAFPNPIKEPKPTTFLGIPWVPKEQNQIVFVVISGLMNYTIDLW